MKTIICMIFFLFCSEFLFSQSLNLNFNFKPILLNENHSRAENYQNINLNYIYDLNDNLGFLLLLNYQNYNTDLGNINSYGVGIGIMTKIKEHQKVEFSFQPNFSEEIEYYSYQINLMLHNEIRVIDNFDIDIICGIGYQSQIELTTNFGLGFKYNFRD